MLKEKTKELQTSIDQVRTYAGREAERQRLEAERARRDAERQEEEKRVAEAKRQVEEQARERERQKENMRAELEDEMLRHAERKRYTGPDSPHRYHLGPKRFDSGGGGGGGGGHMYRYGYSGRGERYYRG